MLYVAAVFGLLYFAILFAAAREHKADLHLDVVLQVLLDFLLCLF